MNDIFLTPDMIEAFRQHLRSEEKSPNTIEKYVRDTKAFARFLDGRPLEKERTLEYKEALMEERRLADDSINSMLSSLRALFRFIGRTDCGVSCIRIQALPYCPEEKNFTAKEYQCLLAAAADDERLSLLLKVFACTGIRVSELKYFTVEAFDSPSGRAQVVVRCKKKNRRIIVAEKLRREITRYIRKNRLGPGPVFRTRSGRPMDRSNIWKQIKRLGIRAGISPEKVFPHNLRKLFARTFYEKTRDIVELSCLLGHSSINTTKIYVWTTEANVRKQIERIAAFCLTGKKRITTLST